MREASVARRSALGAALLLAIGSHAAAQAPIFEAAYDQYLPGNIERFCAYRGRGF